MRNVLIATLAIICVTWTGLGFAADEATSKKEVKPYPLKTCIISGEELGSMGKPVVKVHNGQEVKFCCKSCIKKFDKDPDGAIKKALGEK